MVTRRVEVGEPHTCTCGKDECPYAGETFAPHTVTSIAGRHYPFPVRPIDSVFVLLILAAAVTLLGSIGSFAGPLLAWLFVVRRTRDYRRSRPVSWPPTEERT